MFPQRQMSNLPTTKSLQLKLLVAHSATIRSLSSTLYTVGQSQVGWKIRSFRPLQSPDILRIALQEPGTQFWPRFCWIHFRLTTGSQSHGFAWVSTPIGPFENTLTGQANLMSCRSLMCYEHGQFFLRKNICHAGFCEARTGKSTSCFPANRDSIHSSFKSS